MTNIKSLAFNLQGPMLAISALCPEIRKGTYSVMVKEWWNYDDNGYVDTPTVIFINVNYKGMYSLHVFQIRAVVQLNIKCHLLIKYGDWSGYSFRRNCRLKILMTKNYTWTIVQLQWLENEHRCIITLRNTSSKCEKRQQLRAHMIKKRITKQKSDQRNDEHNSLAYNRYF